MFYVHLNQSSIHNICFYFKLFNKQNIHTVTLLLHNLDNTSVFHLSHFEINDTPGWSTVDWFFYLITQFFLNNRLQHVLLKLLRILTDLSKYVIEVVFQASKYKLKIKKKTDDYHWLRPADDFNHCLAISTKAPNYVGARLFNKIPEDLISRSHKLPRVLKKRLTLKCLEENLCTTWKSLKICSILLKEMLCPFYLYKLWLIKFTLCSC